MQAGCLKRAKNTTEEEENRNKNYVLYYHTKVDHLRKGFNTYVVVTKYL